MSVNDKSSYDVITTSSERHGSSLETYDALTTSCEADSFFRDPLNDDTIVMSSEQSASSNDTSVKSRGSHTSRSNNASATSCDPQASSSQHDAIVTSQEQSSPSSDVPFDMPGSNVFHSQVSKLRDPNEVTGRDKKVMYRVTLQPRLTDSNPGPSMPPQYLELFERLQPKIIAQGYTSEAESLLTLNRCLRPKKESVASGAGSPRGPTGGQQPTPAPLRVIGGRRMPQESFVKEREMAPWASKKYTAVTTPRAPNGDDGTDAGRRRRPSLEEGLGTAATAAKKPFSVRPRSLGGTMRERQILSSRIRSLPPPPPLPTPRRNLDSREDEFSGSGSGRRVQLSPSLSSYRSYSQRVFQNARKLNCFDDSDDERPEHRRSMSFDWSSAATEEEGFGQSPPASTAAPSFHSPQYLSHVTSPESEDERSFLRDPRRLQDAGTSRTSLQDLEISHPNNHIRVDKTVFKSENKNTRLIGNDAQQDSTAISGIEALFRVLALSASHNRSADTEKLDAEPATDRLMNSGSTDGRRPNSVAAPTADNKNVIRNWTENPTPTDEVDPEAQNSAGQDHEGGSTTETFVSKVTILLQRKNDFRTPVNSNRRTMQLHSLQQLRKIAEQNDIFND